MKLVSILFSLLLLAAQPALAVVTVGFGQSSGGSGSFVGSPGDIESFEAPGISLTTEITETDPDGVINCSSSTAALSGSFGCLFSNGSSASHTNFVKADIGSGDASFSISWRMKTPTSSSIYSNYAMFRSRSDDDPGGTQTADSSYILFDNNSSNCKILLYSYSGASVEYTDSSVTLSYDTEYRLTLSRTNNTIDGLVLEIRDSSNTVVDTLVVDATDDMSRYFYWFDMQSGNDYYVDYIQYNSTAP